jgi:hypothetical protein
VDIAEMEPVTKEDEVVTKSWDDLSFKEKLDEITSGIREENAPLPDLPSENQAKPKSCYKYHRISLVVVGDRAELLKRLCSNFGIGQDRIDDHQQDVVWELLEILEPLLDARAQKKEEIRADIKRHKLSKEDLF